ncbi:glutaminyl-tRNA synthetase [Gyrodon lividus]|nr:glutaminyl-tRNA synthetase [Gyrodon lividus]
MATKANTSTATPGDFISLFQSIGLSRSKAAEAAKNAKSATVLSNLIRSHDLASESEPLGEKRAVLIAALAVQLTKTQNVDDAKQAYIVKAIYQEKLKSVDQVNVAAKYFEIHSLPVNEAEFNETCGVGFTITPEQLDTFVKKYTETITVSGWANLGAAISGVKNTLALRWANPLDIKNAVERVFTETFGAKEAAKPKAKEPKVANVPAEVSDNSTSVSDAAQRAKSRKVVFEEGFLGALHKPGENIQIKPELREQHLAATGSKVYTRFPPEPNGYLHIGHCKAIFVDFGYAAHHGGGTYLRFDDTNPEKEEARYFTSIIEVVRWLGFEPWRITYSSDYFDQLHELAIELIKRDKAYVCHCSQEQMKADRGEKIAAPRACIHRDRPIEESLTEFKKMKDGFYRPKEAFLRMKQDLTDPNPQMWDLTAYRVLDASHHRTHDKWKIYPTYDYTHCLVDSFENISHSLCTTEFVTSRQSYEWLCDALEVYKPRQSEFGRLNVTGTINSKRKILQLVNEGYVTGWDDPRLYTVIALRRRGVPAEAILSFVSTVGVSTAVSNIQIGRFDQTVRQYLEGTAPRLLMVLRPLKVTIENLPEDYVLMVEKPLHPKIPELGISTIPFTRTIYIEADDFRLEDSKDYFRLAPGKTVGLFQAPRPITCTSFKTDPSTGQVTELICRLEDKGNTKPKAYIQWVAEHAPSGSPVRVDETRIFYPLFKSDNPLAAVPDFKADIDPHSIDVVKGAMVEVGFWPLTRESVKNALAESRARAEKSKADGAEQSLDPDTPVVIPEQLVGQECIRFQGLRVAYFAVDSDSRLSTLDDLENPCGRSQGDYLVLNRIVSLKEDAGKGA